MLIRREIRQSHLELTLSSAGLARDALLTIQRRIGKTKHSRFEALAHVGTRSKPILDLEGERQMGLQMTKEMP